MSCNVLDFSFTPWRQFSLRRNTVYYFFKLHEILEFFTVLFIVLILLLFIHLKIKPKRIYKGWDCNQTFEIVQKTEWPLFTLNLILRHKQNGNMTRLQLHIPHHSMLPEITLPWSSALTSTNFAWSLLSFPFSLSPWSVHLS